MDEGHTYDAFMSYSHSADRHLAPELQRLIRRVGRPWYRRGTLRIFRDQTNLLMSEDLWGTIETGLRNSRYFMLMASPESAASAWVAREVQFWREHRDSSTFFIVLTAGAIKWDKEKQDFDPTIQDNALPEAVTGWYASEPNWVSIIPPAGEPVRRSQRNDRLRDVARTIAAPLYGVDKDRLDGEDERESRRARRTLQGGIATLAVLAVIAVVAAILAVVQLREANAQARNSLSRQLAAIADNELNSNLDLANLLAVRALRTNANPQSRAALLRAVTANGQLVRYLPFNTNVSAVAGSADGSTVVAGLADGRVMRWPVTGSQPEQLFRLGSAVSSVAMSADGGVVAAADKTSAQLIRPQRTAVPLTAPAGWEMAAVAVSPSGRTAILSEAESRFRGAKSATVLTLGGDDLQRVEHELMEFQLTPDNLATSDDEVLLLEGGYGTWERRRLTDWTVLSRDDSGFGTANYGVAVAANGSAFSYTNGAAAVPVWRTDRPTDLDHPPLTGLTSLAALPNALTLNDDATRLAVAEGGTIHVAPVAAPGASPGASIRLAGAGTVTGLRFLGNQSRKLVTTAGNKVAMWDLDQIDRISHGFSVPVGSGCNACGPPAVAVSPDGSQVAVVDGSGSTGAVGPLDRLNEIKPLPDLKLSALYAATVWDADGRQATLLVQPMMGGTESPVPAGMPNLVRAVPAGQRANGVAAAGSTSDSRQLIVVENDGGIDLVDVGSGTSRTVLPDPNAPVAPKAPRIQAAAVSSTANLIAIADEATVIVRDGLTGTELGRTQLNGVRQLRFIPGGLLVQRESGELALWDEHLHQINHVLPGDQIWPPVASPNGDIIARAETDGSITIVDQKSGALLVTIPSRRPGSKVGIGFAGNGNRLVTVTEPDGLDPAAADYRDIGDESLVRTACNTAGRDLTSEEWRALVGRSSRRVARCRPTPAIPPR